MHAVLHKGLKFNQVIDRWVCKVVTQGQEESIPKRLSSVTSYNKFWWKFVYRLWGWNMQTDMYAFPSMHSFYTLCEKNTQKSVFFKVSFFTFGLLFVDMDISYTRVLHIKVAYHVPHKWRHAFYVTRPLLCAHISCYVTVITHGRCYAHA
jgi:hypothetical protein